MLYVDKTPVKTGEFPNNETYLDFDSFIFLDRDAPHEICCKFESNNDLMLLFMLKRTMDDMGFNNVSLFIPYLPYAALDRTNGIRCLGAKYIGEILNSLRFRYVKTWEAHSDVVLATVNGIQNTLKSAELARSVQDGENQLMVFPDNGAKKRYMHVLQPKEYVVLDKTRLFEDGKLTDSKFIEATKAERATQAIIVDDLCRGGRTACLAAKAVREAYPKIKRVDFCVAHTEDTVYTGPILEDSNIDRICTTNSCLTHVSHSKLLIMEEIV